MNSARLGCFPTGKGEFSSLNDSLSVGADRRVRPFWLLKKSLSSGHKGNPPYPPPCQGGKKKQKLLYLWWASPFYPPC